MDCGHWSQSATQILLKANDPEAFNNINSRHEKSHFLSRFWAADDFRLPGHLNQVANEINTARVLAQYIDEYVSMQQGVVKNAKDRVSEISKAISKIK